MPDNAEAQINLGAALATLGRGTEALEHFTKALTLKPDYAKGHYNLASLLAEQGRLQEATEHYQRALELAPNLTRARYQYALLLQRQGHFAEAAGEFQKIVTQDPKHVAALNDLAWLLAACPDGTVRDGHRAVELAERAEQLSAGRSPEILDTLAAAYAESGDFQKATATVKNAISLAAAQKKDSLAADLQIRLKLYQSNLPFHDNNLVSQPVR
jgi:tetratricopeptide (TPR) repeat protein